MLCPFIEIQVTTSQRSHGCTSNVTCITNRTIILLTGNDCVRSIAGLAWTVTLDPEDLIESIFLLFFVS